MGTKSSGQKKSGGEKRSQEDLNRIVTRARQAEDERLKGYREQSLRIHPWVCARCGREFTVKNLHLLTVHHKDHNHENNPSGGSNWENLCIYCHDNEHRRYLDYEAGAGAGESEKKGTPATHIPFAKLADLLKSDKR
jgi:5-methylcytosine-specific restriction endonuclease McrA